MLKDCRRDLILYIRQPADAPKYDLMDEFEATLASQRVQTTVFTPDWPVT